MAENYKHLYEQCKKMLDMYQDILVPAWRRKVEELEKKLRGNPVATHGYWEPYADYFTKRQIGWICSSCSVVVNDLANGEAPFCPYCGAIMDEDTPNITDQTEAALEQMGRKAHGGSDNGEKI